MTSTTGCRGRGITSWLTGERIDCPVRLVPGDIQSGYADPPVLGDADDTQVEQRVVQRAESQWP